MKKYLKVIEKANTIDELMGVIIAYSQDLTLSWAQFMKCHEKAEEKKVLLRKSK